MSNIFFSVCVPSFNRLERLKLLVTEFLAADTENTNLVITDNCSTDGTDLFFQNNCFKNILYKKNERNIGGTTNVVKALLNAEGTFALLCLDKDSVKFSELSSAIALLENKPEIAFGKFKEPSTYFQSEISITSKGLPSVLQHGFLSEHPTGIFFRSVYLKELPFVNSVFKKNEKFPFYIDILTGYFSLLGSYATIYRSAIKTEKLEKIKSQGSLTYDKKDVYFLPKKRSEVFHRYLYHLSNLSLIKSDRKIVEEKLLGTLVQDVTVNLSSMYKNVHICNHYGVSPRQYTSYNYLGSVTEIYFRYLFVATNLSVKEKTISYLKAAKRIMKTIQFLK